MGTYDVALPAGKKAVFPRLCVVCEKPNPDGVIALSIIGAQTDSFALEVAELALDGTTYGSNTSNEIKGIPACARCAGGLKWYHRLYKVALYTAWLPGLLLVIVLPGPTFLKVLLFLGFVIAPPILSIVFPPAFGATFLNDKATFEFTSQKIADEFKRLNAVTA